ncbi:MAG: bifunctional metallophosphatase/5'-nucleotidase [Spirochaetales bacterium]|nr:MAG: bifunctional metallophosphatase/5'-nucleotidase [Spirochaetales bacterium]
MKTFKFFLTLLALLTALFFISCQTEAPAKTEAGTAQEAAPAAEEKPAAEAAAGPEKVPVTLKFIETTDIHGSLYPYNFITDKPVGASLAQVYAYVTQERAKADQQVVLLDDGDILQGQPVVYYYNFENTQAKHIQSQVMNFMKYDAGTLGNHDIEAGHPVYDKLVKEFSFPWLAANAVKPDGTPYFKPYTVLNKGGLKIAVIGLITPWIPNWLPQQFWTGMEFEDMTVSAEKWIKIVKETEKPDLIVGLFHSGVDFTYGGANADTPKNENASELVATRVPGFDLIFTGHDHQQNNKVVKDPNGRDVYIFGSQNAARNISSVTVKLTWDKAAGAWSKAVSGEIMPVEGLTADAAFLKAFDSQFNEVKGYVSRPIGKMTNKITTRDSMFGDSAFVDLIHNIQLDLTSKPDFGLNKAEISFAAPLSADASIPSSADGTLYVRDMFNLYVYENFLYTMQMTGQQVKDFLEFSYAGWFNTMKGANDNIINFKKDASGNLVMDEKTGMPVPAVRYYNYDSAAGIIYSVDVTKPAGSRITITSMADKTPFDLKKTYSVAINSYRAQGGGGHLTSGAKMNDTDVKAMKYVTSSTIKDLRFYLMKWFEGQKGPVAPAANGTWKVIPDANAKAGKTLDMPLLYK